MVRTSGSRPGKAGGATRQRRKHARGSGAEFVYEALRSDILGLQMEPGNMLDETELAERFNLSRSPVREALIRLSGEGLVQTLRNRSTIVAPFDVAAIPSYLDASELVYRVTARLAAINRHASQLAAQGPDSCLLPHVIVAQERFRQTFFAALAGAEENHGCTPMNTG